MHLPRLFKESTPHFSIQLIQESSFATAFLSFVLLLLGAIEIGPPAFAEESPPAFHLDFFSLNRKEEFLEAKRLVDRINAYGFEQKIEVHENANQNGNEEPANLERTFLKMVEHEGNTDGLVISGHHTSAFQGQLFDSESLDIDYLEKLSCDPKLQKWFEHIRVLWLQGCNTIGTGNLHSADIDPMFSRYLLVFPNATIFGWTATAPGENARSEDTLPFHLAHFSKFLTGRHLNESPIQPFGKDTARALLDAFLGLLDPSKQMCQGKADAWRAMGHIENPFSLDNSDINAALPLNSGTDKH